MIAIVDVSVREMICICRKRMNAYHTRVPDHSLITNKRNTRAAVGSVEVTKVRSAGDGGVDYFSGVKLREMGVRPVRPVRSLELAGTMFKPNQVTGSLDKMDPDEALRGPRWFGGVVVGTMAQWCGRRR